MTYDIFLHRPLSNLTKRGNLSALCCINMRSAILSETGMELGLLNLDFSCLFARVGSSPSTSKGMRSAVHSEIEMELGF